TKCAQVSQRETAHQVVRLQKFQHRICADAGQWRPFPCTPSPKTQICTHPKKLCCCAIEKPRWSDFCFLADTLLRTLLEGIATLDRKIAEAAEAHPDFFIFQSLPGAGAALAPRLLAALGSQRDRYGGATEVQKYSGIAPVTERSGKKKWVHFRWACPKFLRQSFHEWAGHSIAQSVWARAYYQRQRERGKEHHAAVRALAFKWIRIVFR